MTRYSGTRTGKRLGKRLGGALWTDINEPGLRSLPNCSYVLDANTAVDDGSGKAASATDEAHGYVFSSTAPTGVINTTDIAGQKTIVGAVVLGLDNATVAGRWDSAGDYTVHVWCKLALLGEEAGLVHHSAGGAALPFVGASIFDNVLTTFSASSGIKCQKRNSPAQGGTTDISAVSAFTRDTTSFHMFTAVRSGGSVTAWYDGVKKNTVAYSPGTILPTGMTRVSLGGSTGAHWKIWAEYSSAHTDAEIGDAYAMMLARVTP